METGLIENTSKIWPMIVAVIGAAVLIGGAVVRFDTIEGQVMRHERFFRSVAINQYLMCRSLNTINKGADKLECHHPKE